MAVQPIGDRVLVKPLETEEMSKGGVIIQIGRASCRERV